MPQIVYIILCQKTPLDLSGKHDHSRGYKTILGVYEQLAAANATLEILFNRFLIHQYNIESCGMLGGGSDKLSSATATTEGSEYCWSIHAEVLRKDLGSPF